MASALHLIAMLDLPVGSFQHLDTQKLCEANQRLCLRASDHQLQKNILEKQIKYHSSPNTSVQLS